MVLDLTISRLYVNRTKSVCVGGGRGGVRARAGRDKELALGHTDFAPDSFVNKSPRK